MVWSGIYLIVLLPSFCGAVDFSSDSFTGWSSECQSLGNTRVIGVAESCSKIGDFGATVKSWLGFEEPLHCVAVAQLEGSTKVAKFELNLHGGFKKNPNKVEGDGEAFYYMPVKYDCNIIEGNSYPSDFQSDVDCKVGQCAEYNAEFKVPSDCAWLGAKPGITIGMVATWADSWNTANMLQKDNNWDSSLGYSIWDDNCQKFSVDLMSYFSGCTNPQPQQQDQMKKLVPILIGVAICCVCCCVIASQVLGGGPKKSKRGLAKDDSEAEGTESDYASESEAE